MAIFAAMAPWKWAAVTVAAVLAGGATGGAPRAAIAGAVAALGVTGLAATPAGGFPCAPCTISAVTGAAVVAARGAAVGANEEFVLFVSALGLMVGLLCAIWLAARGINHVDAIFAIGIAIFLLFNAWTIAVQSGHNLMDRELSEQEQQQITSIAAAHPGAPGRRFLY